MEREELERLKERARPIMEVGRSMFGKEVYDNHIKELLEYFDMEPNNNDVKEIFDL